MMYQLCDNGILGLFFCCSGSVDILCRKVNPILLKYETTPEFEKEVTKSQIFMSIPTPFWGRPGAAAGPLLEREVDQEMLGLSGDQGLAPLWLPPSFGESGGPPHNYHKEPPTTHRSKGFQQSRLSKKSFFRDDPPMMPLDLKETVCTRNYRD